MANNKCGECKQVVHDLEPIFCGFCDTSYHINQQCCGLNVRTIKDAFTTGKAIFICPHCRLELNGRSIRAYLADNQMPKNTDASPLSDLPKQVQELSAVVEKLSQKIESFASQSSQSHQTKSVFTTSPWPRLGAKRRREDRKPETSTPAINGTKAVDLSGIQFSVPSIVQVAVPEKFWLYMTGLNPLINDNDVHKIVESCLTGADSVDVVRLVPKGKEITNLTFVSYKIGLDPNLKELAMEPSSWPVGVRIREFVNYSKN